jgi:hypothetical protein
MGELTLLKQRLAPSILSAWANLRDGQIATAVAEIRLHRSVRSMHELIG